MGWFKSRGVRANFDQYVKPLAGTAACPRRVRYVEFGCWRGESGAWAAINLLAHPESVGLGVDPWAALTGHSQEEMDANHAFAVARCSPFLRWRFVRQPSSVWLREFRQSAYWDVMYIDGDHTAPLVLDDAVLCWPLLAVGGLLIFDDYANPRNRSNHVCHAADAFLSVYRPFVDVVYTNSQLCLRKVREYVSDDSGLAGVRLS